MLVEDLDVVLNEPEKSIVKEQMRSLADSTDPLCDLTSSFFLGLGEVGVEGG